WPVRESPVSVLRGQEARLIEAEARLATDPGGALALLNEARATVAGLVPLADAGSAAARVDQLFRERAFWNFGRGARVGDMRRLIRQYDRAPDDVFPTGAWHKFGAYGSDVNFPIPQAESNNPLADGASCMDRNA
ncbi:MAG: RagB/SusD family nutrient uptake outer membrane protein, partial [Gemmatimonadaceae bacterium]